MSNTYGFPGAGLGDLISTLKGTVSNGGLLGRALANVFPPPTAATSPLVIGVNNLGTVGTAVMTATTGLMGLVVHNPATANVNAYVYPLSVATTPTLSAPGGAFIVLPGETLPFPSVFYANFNVGLGAFVSTGTTGALTITQFF
jgi:hypothetical protein